MDIHSSLGPHIPPPLEQRYSSLVARRRTFARHWPRRDQRGFLEHAIWGFYCLPSPSSSPAPTIRCFYCGVLLGLVRRVLLPQTHLRNCLYYLVLEAERRPSIARTLELLVPRHSDISLHDLQRTRVAMAAAQLREQQRERDRVVAAAADENDDEDDRVVNIALVTLREASSSSSSTATTPTSSPPASPLPRFIRGEYPDPFSRTVLMEPQQQRPWSPLTNSLLYAALYATARSAHPTYRTRRPRRSRPQPVRTHASRRRGVTSSSSSSSISSASSREYQVLVPPTLANAISVTDSTRLGVRRNAILLGSQMDQIVLSTVDRLLEQYIPATEEPSSQPTVLVAGRVLATPQHQDRMRYEDRLATFAQWPPSMPITGHQLAAAGFFYANVTDSVTCFHCGSVLRAWTVNDDPWTRHARIILTADDDDAVAATSDCCPFVYMVKGDTFVRTAREETAVAAAAVPPDQPETPTNNNDDDDDKAAATTCIACCAESPSVMFAPCGHLVSCYNCALGRDQCFVCRQKIDALHRVFYA